MIFTSQAGEDNVEVRVADETVWLTQKLMAELFAVERSVITKHLDNIFKDGELNRDSVCANFAHTAASRLIPEDYELVRLQEWYDVLISARSGSAIYQDST